MYEAVTEHNLAPFTRDGHKLTLHHIGKHNMGPIVPVKNNVHSKLHRIKNDSRG